MKKFSLLLLVFFPLVFAQGMFKDIRDNKEYKIKRIGEYTWFLQDLNHGKNKYAWDEAQEACPRGWRLPHNNEWAMLKEDAGPEDIKEFVSDSSGYWWSASAGDVRHACHWFVEKGELKYHYTSNDVKTVVSPVRCVRD